MGNVAKIIEYDCFGNIINDTNSSFILPFGFAGGLLDRDTNLVRFGYRDYDLDVGRWTAKDQIGFAGGSVDLYGYCLNEPIRFIDPCGTRIEWGGYILNNQTLRNNLMRLNQEIVNSGIPDDQFVLRVTGGDRYKDSKGNIRSATNHQIIANSSSTSPHLIERVARAVDLQIQGVNNEVFDQALRNTSYLPENTVRGYPDGNTHIALPNRPEYYYYFYQGYFGPIYSLGEEGDNPCQ